MALLALPASDVAEAWPVSPFAAPFESWDSPDGMRAMRIRDLDGDGRPDLIALTTNLLNVYLGQPGGGFAAAQVYDPNPSGNFPITMDLGDFDGDGRTDVVAANTFTNSLGVMLGTPGGGFGPATQYPAGPGPAAVAAADFDGDGVLDLATWNFPANEVRIFEGAGNGSFAPLTTIDLGGDGEEFAPLFAADFTGDGHSDVLVSGATPGLVTVLPGNGDGTFGAPRTSPGTATPAHFMAVGHVDGDGILDLVDVTRFDPTFRALLGDGTGHFTVATTRPLPTCAGSIAVGDLDADGRSDVAVGLLGCPYVSAPAIVLRGHGDGSFAATLEEHESGMMAAAVAIGDVHGDGRADLVVGNAGSENIAVIAGLPGGTFTALTRVDTSPFPHDVRVVDLNGDDLPDLALTHTVHDQYGAQPGQVSIRPGLGDGTFGPEVSTSVGYQPVALALGDLDHDGRPDIVTANQHDLGSISILLATPAGTYSRTDVAAGEYPLDVEVVDLDGDGHRDIVVGRVGLTFGVLRGNGDGSFAPLAPVSAGRTSSGIAAGDFNGDAVPDLAIAGDAGVSVLIGNGSGGFLAPVHVATGSGARDVVAADVDGDGDLDLAVVCYTTAVVTVLRGTGAGGFGGRTDHSTGSHRADGIAVGDLDQDGWPDLVAPRASSSTAAVWFGNGAGGFDERVDVGTGEGPRRAAIGDLDLDGRPDVAVTGWNTGGDCVCPVGNGVTLLMNRPAAVVGVPPPVEAASALAIDRVTPNPAHGPVRFEYSLPAAAAHARLSVLDTQGRELATLDGPSAPGRHQVRWEGRHARGLAPAGVYFVRLRAGSQSVTRRFVLVR